MNSLYLQQTRSLFSSLITILTLVMVLFLIARSAAFLSLTLESGLSAFTFLKYILFQIPVQVTTLLPLCFFAACITTFNSISAAGEHIILRSAGASQSSFFLPAHLVGFTLCIFYLPFLFEVSPWANRNILEIERQSREQLAQNTLINAGEPTFIGSAEVYVQNTEGANLSDISLFGKNGKNQEVFIHGKAANFIIGTNGIALVMSDGQVLQSQNQNPSTIQHFQNLLIDLNPLIQDEGQTFNNTGTLSLSLYDLFNDLNKSEAEVLNHRKEGARRLAYLCLIFALPSWILFWQLLEHQSRGGKSRLVHLGPILLIPIFVLLESPGIYVNRLPETFGFLLMLGFIGPIYYTILGWNLNRRISLA